MRAHSKTCGTLTLQMLPTAGSFSTLIMAESALRCELKASTLLTAAPRPPQVNHSLQLLLRLHQQLQVLQLSPLQLKDVQEMLNSNLVQQSPPLLFHSPNSRLS